MRPWRDNIFIGISSLSYESMHPYFLQEGWKEIPHPDVVTTKNRISQIENADEWEIRKKITNPYEAIFSGEEVSFPSLARVQPLSRSYFKMIEILHHIKFWDNLPDTPFISAHVCEGPGGFIQAVVERLIQLKKQTKGIYAMTLKPTKSHIPGWRRSSHFLKKYNQVHLEYGADDTGNILIPGNQEAFRIRAAGAHLFTADGGFDFSVNYTNQEQMAFPLLLASFTMGLQTLSQGGTMIIKLFDIYGKATQDLLLGSALFFDKFTLYKPATSRPCNSERYFIGTGYHGSAKAELFIRHLQEAYVKHEQAPLTHLFKNPWPVEIIAAIEEQIKWQENLQIRTITETLNLQKDSIYDNILQGIQLSREWCELFDVKIDTAFTNE
jgi:23S rRNA U2552 (ribose-2'-O)-methylase RlmE/FtsJ